MSNTRKTLTAQEQARIAAREERLGQLVTEIEAKSLPLPEKKVPTGLKSHKFVTLAGEVPTTFNTRKPVTPVMDEEAQRLLDAALDSGEESEDDSRPKIKP